MRKTKKVLFGLLLLFVPGVLMGCSQTTDNGEKTLYNVDSKKVVLRGYDVVAYFSDGKPTQGSAEHSVTWAGAVWYFSSASNKERFEKEPAKYAPQYGAFCAWATAEGYKANSDPKYWKIVDGKLYVNYDQTVQEKWLKDVPGFIKKADTNWPEVQKKPLQ